MSTSALYGEDETAVFFCVACGHFISFTITKVNEDPEHIVCGSDSSDYQAEQHCKNPMNCSLSIDLTKSKWSYTQQLLVVCCVHNSTSYITSDNATLTITTGKKFLLCISVCIKRVHASVCTYYKACHLLLIKV